MYCDNACYSCGINLPDQHVVVDLICGLQYCSQECFTSGKKYEPPEIDPDTNPLTVPVRGKCNGQVIKGTASFSMHGDVFLEFTEPQLKGSFVVPKIFLQIVAEMYENSDEKNSDSEEF
jgi:hypothetical protein